MNKKNYALPDQPHIIYRRLLVKKPSKDVYPIFYINFIANREASNKILFESTVNKSIKTAKEVFDGW